MASGPDPSPCLLPSSSEGAGMGSRAGAQRGHAARHRPLPCLPGQGAGCLEQELLGEMETESLPGTWTLATPSCLLSCCKWIQEPPSPACPTLWSGQTAAASHARGGCISVIQRRWAAVPSLIRGDLALAQRPASPRPAGELREYTVPFRGLGPPGQPAPSQLPFGERAWGYMIPLRASGGCITHRCLTMALAPSSPVTSAWPAMENAVAPWAMGVTDGRPAGSPLPVPPHHGIHPPPGSGWRLKPDRLAVRCECLTTPVINCWNNFPKVGWILQGW
ncbi:uncharacterized protein LOC127054874 isoform X2 [Gopherus flavomarginatus]|uniref:uncharacterized protein LOC127054874 isoform X2 n=1 Tax=Gopherus flavomarginatus TaxID=286002 RepID=UPI0021CC4796|nr:uncharacterized protein LOC127054874 isoform X2 [Gopherus flavomarginatus]